MAKEKAPMVAPISDYVHSLGYGISENIILMEFAHTGLDEKRRVVARLFTDPDSLRSFAETFSKMVASHERLLKDLREKKRRKKKRKKAKKKTKRPRRGK